MNRKEPGKHRSGGKLTDVAEYLAKRTLERALTIWRPFSEE